MIADEILRDLSSALNPIAFAKRLCFSNLDQWQEDLLLSTDPRIILNCARQVGKSSMCAILALFNALNYPGSLVLLVSPSQRQSVELFRKVAGYWRDLGKPVPAEIENVLSLQLSNRSRIVALPGKSGDTLRGFSAPSLILVDEAARVSDELFYGAIMPMLSVSEGRLILLSTPWGKRGIYFEAYENGGDLWRRFKVTAYDCPRISHEWLEEQRKIVGDWFFRQEMLCEFSENEDSYFTFEEISNAFSPDVEPLFPDED
jgi:hypothetical protein